MMGGVQASSDADDKVMRCCSCCAKSSICQPVVAALRSSICLTLVFLSYVVAGAFLFKFVELDRDAIKYNNETTVLVSSSLCDVTSGNTSDISRQLQDLKESIDGGTGWTDIAENELRKRWSFAGSLLYSVALITTVGYGRQIPHTTAGLLTSLPYALFGIPLSFYFLSRAGRDLAALLRSLYRRVCCDLLCCKRCQRRRRRRIYSTGGVAAFHQRSPDGASYVGPNNLAGDTLYHRAPSHVYESIGYNDVTWPRRKGHVTEDSDLHRYPSNAKYNSLPHQIPQPSPRGRSDGQKSAIGENESGSAKYRKGLKPKSQDESTQIATKENGGFEPEFDDVTRREYGPRKGNYSEVYETIPVVQSAAHRRSGRPRGRSRPTTCAVSSRRSSIIGRRHGRPGRPVSAGHALGRMPPVGEASKDGDIRDSTVGVAPPDGRDSDVESFVTAYNFTPLLSRSLPATNDQSTSASRAARRRDYRKSIQTGSSGRRRRRRLKSPSPQRGHLEEPAAEQQNAATYDQQRVPVDPSCTYVGDRDRHYPTVPIPLCVVILSLYVLSGAVIFTQLYGLEDWPRAVYVSFAALSTVGGWYPELGRTRTDRDGWPSWPPDPQLVYALWLVGGLTVVSACVQLTLEALSTASSLSGCSRRTTDNTRPAV